MELVLEQREADDGEAHLHLLQGFTLGDDQYEVVQQDILADAVVVPAKRHFVAYRRAGRHRESGHFDFGISSGGDTVVLCEPPTCSSCSQIFNTDEASGWSEVRRGECEYTERSCYVSLEDPECGCHGEYAWWISQNDVDDLASILTSMADDCVVQDAPCCTMQTIDCVFDCFCAHTYLICKANYQP